MPAPHGHESLTLTYVGLSLGQYDLDVFIAFLRLAVPAGLGRVVQVSGRQVLEECGLSDCSENYDRLKASLRRLWMARFSIATSDMTAGTPWSLLEAYSQKRVARNGAGAVEFTHSISYAVGVELGGLFHLNTWVTLDTEVRRRLRGPGEQLARWLHALLATFGPTYETDLATLYEQSGATCQPDAFIKQFKAASKLLERCKAVIGIKETTVSGTRVKGVPLRNLRRRRVTFSRPAVRPEWTAAERVRHVHGTVDRKPFSSACRTAPESMVDLEMQMF
jgi:plasmid replication initiation protein